MPDIDRVIAGLRCRDLLSQLPDYVDGDKITPTGLKKLKDSMPHADFSALEDDPFVSKLPDLFTVSTIVNYVENKLAAA